MRITLNLNLPGLEPGGESESKKSRKRRKRFKEAMKDLEVYRSEHLISVLEALLAENAEQLQGDLFITTGDWFHPHARRRLVEEHADRASILGETLVLLFEKAAEEADGGE